MGKTKRKWIQLDFSNADALRAEDIPFDATQDIKTKIDSLGGSRAMPGLLVGGTDNQWGYACPEVSTTTAMGDMGLLASLAYQDSSSSVSSQSDGLVFRQASSGIDAEIFQAGNLHTWENNLYTVGRIGLQSVTDGYWYGFCSGVDPSKNDTILSSGAGIHFRPSRDTNFQFLVSDGFTQNLYDMGVAPVNGTTYIFVLDLHRDNTSFTATIYDKDFQTSLGTQTVTTTLPALSNTTRLRHETEGSTLDTYYMYLVTRDQ